jgi:hypothetical protein
MSNKALEELVQHMENYIECWKQFNQFIALARAKKFGPEDENHFLEVQSVIVQELELILAAMEIGSPTKEEVHALVASAPSLRYLADSQEGVLRNIETQWHRIYLGWHAILGQLKVQQQAEEGKSPLAALFGKRSKK